MLWILRKEKKYFKKGEWWLVLDIFEKLSNIKIGEYFVDLVIKNIIRMFSRGSFIELVICRR